jgi:hypothetical protein
MRTTRWVAVGIVAAALGWQSALGPGGAAGVAAAPTKPDGEMRWALYVTLSVAWLDPGEVTGQLTPFWVLYAIRASHRAPPL